MCLSAFALLTGGIIYILFRASEPLFFRYLNAAGLWAFAYALVITSIWSWGMNSFNMQGFYREHSAFRI